MVFLNIFLVFGGDGPIPPPNPLVNIFFIKKMVTVSEPVVHKRERGRVGGRALSIQISWRVKMKWGGELKKQGLSLPL